MAEVATFQRIYSTFTGPEHAATPVYVSNVLRSMQESKDSDLPFRVRFRFSDGSVTVVKPKGWRG